MNETKLWNRNFIKLMIGLEFTLMANALLRFALPLYVFLQTGNSTLMGSVLTLSSIPLILLTPIGGAMSDRFSKKKILAIVNLATAVVIAIAFGVSGMMSTVPFIIITMLFLLTLEGMLSPTYEASVPALVPTDQLIKANSASFLLSTVSSIGAPILGGFIIYAHGLGPILIISAVLYGLATFVSLFIKIPYKPEKSEKGLLKVIFGDIKDAVVYIVKDNPLVRKLVIVIFLYGVTMIPAVLIGLPVLLTRYLGMAEGSLGFIQGIVAAGAAVGVLLVGFLGKHANSSIIRLLLLIAASGMVPIALSIMFLDDLSNTMALIIIVGSFAISFAAASIFGVIGWTAFGQKASEHMVGKVLSLAMSIMILGMSIGNYLHGFLLDHFIERPEIALFTIIGASFMVALGSKFKKQ